MTLFEALVFSIGINILMFIPAYIYKTDKLTDLSYSLTFFFIAIYSLYQSTSEILHIILAAMIVVWSVRLGSYLFIRIRKMEKDKRFDGIRENFYRFLKFWVLQGLSVWVILIPYLYFIQKADVQYSYLTYIGFVIWLIGILIESIADYQKYKFINNPINKGKWIESGLWKYSRHPNYFGEILLWIGVYIFSLSTISGLEAWIALIGPVYIAILIIFVTGLPMLEKGADKRWGDNPSYRNYRRNTNILVPWLKKDDKEEA